MCANTDNKQTRSKSYSLVSYFALCFIIAWSVWIPAGILAPGATALAIPGGWAPTIAALLLTWRAGGRDGVRELLQGILKWRVRARYYLFAVFGALGIALLAAGLNALLGGTFPDLQAIAARFGVPAEPAYLFIAISPLVFITTIFIGGPIAEELGWRGYAQPRLQARMGAGLAGLVIGFIWSLWHLPLFYFIPSAVAGLPLGHYIPLVSALGVLFAWLYNRTGGSVLLCILLHAGVNFAFGVFGEGTMAADSRLLTIFVALLAILAAVLFLRIRLVTDIRSSHNH